MNPIGPRENSSQAGMRLEAWGLCPQPAMDVQALRDPVTLIVYEWAENRPGTLSWVFPTLGAAIRAVRALRNALRWMIVAGTEVSKARANIDELRNAGGVLAERLA